MKKKLKREIEHEALVRLEDAARTQADYENVVLMWDKLDGNRERRERRHEIRRADEEMLHWDKLDENDEKGTMSSDFGVVIPRPLEHPYWREQIRGDFIDVIFDCPHDIPEMAPSRSIYAIVKDLSEDKKEILYYWAIRKWSPQRIAAYRG